MNSWLERSKNLKSFTTKLDPRAGGSSKASMHPYVHQPRVLMDHLRSAQKLKAARFQAERFLKTDSG